MPISRNHCPASVGNGESVLPLRQRRERVKKERKYYTAEEKVSILRRHLLEQEPVSKLCPSRRSSVQGTNVRSSNRCLAAIAPLSPVSPALKRQDERESSELLRGTSRPVRQEAPFV